MSVMAGLFCGHPERYYEHPNCWSTKGNKQLPLGTCSNWVVAQLFSLGVSSYKPETALMKKKKEKKKRERDRQKRGGGREREASGNERKKWLVTSSNNCYYLNINSRWWISCLSSEFYYDLNANSKMLIFGKSRNNL